MSRRLYPLLLAMALLLGALVCGFVVFEPLLNLPPFWNQLDIGIALTGYSALMLVGAFIVNRRLWPKKWRLSRKPAGCLKFMQRFIAIAWGIDENRDSGE
jgi:hypothetical protein